MTGLTHRQRECLDAIVAYDAEFGCSPTFDELKDRLGLASKSGVHRLLDALEERHCIRRLRNRACAIEVIAKPPEACLPPPAMLQNVETSDLLEHMAQVGVVLAHRLGVAKFRETLDRIGNRLAGSR